MKNMQKHTKKVKIGKNATQIGSFFQNNKETKMEIFAFCVITFDPIKI